MRCLASSRVWLTAAHHGPPTNPCCRGTRRAQDGHVGWGGAEGTFIPLMANDEPVR